MKQCLHCVILAYINVNDVTLTIGTTGGVAPPAGSAGEVTTYGPIEICVLLLLLLYHYAAARREGAISVAFVCSSVRPSLRT